MQNEFKTDLRVVELQQNLWDFADSTYYGSNKEKRIYVTYELLKKMATKLNVFDRDSGWNYEERTVVQSWGTIRRRKTYL